ncbi:MAG TPA: hypothetical protein VG818_08640 [Gemmatimonadaceae bacterium]|nr:hypothetical protein [Gemmatimonadaceae bacterium]
MSLLPSHPQPRGPMGHRAPRWHKPLPPRRLFYRRMARHGVLGGAMVLGALLIGVCGYHVTSGLPWLDSLVDASMILSGMGPVDPIRSDAGKWFESFYALFSGVVFITSVGVLFAPVVHRFLHRFHLEVAAEDEPTHEASPPSTDLAP